MVYPCFYYSLTATKMVWIYIFYTNKEQVPWYHWFKETVNYSRVILSMSAMVLLFLSTFFLAIHDQIEFLMKLVEWIVLSQTVFEWILMWQNLMKLIERINKMKTGFSTVNAEIVRRCKKEEKEYFFTFAILVLTGRSIEIGKDSHVNLRIRIVYYRFYPLTPVT
uniref:Uncharacterized protein n=1 Tax=Cacopsylla melanoneura TaxID=428564 RepID=A0A8D8ZSA8_9HEMI